MTGLWLPLPIGKVSGVATITQLLTVIATLQTPTVQFIAGAPPPPCALTGIALEATTTKPIATMRVTPLAFIFDPPWSTGCIVTLFESTLAVGRLRPPALERFERVSQLRDQLHARQRLAQATQVFAA